MHASPGLIKTERRHVLSKIINKVITLLPIAYRISRWGRVRA